MSSFYEGFDYKKKISFSGDSSKIRAYFRGDSFDVPLSEELLSKHILLSGSIGSGKTNAVNGIVGSAIQSMKSNDVMIIFDTKGDFKRKFYRPGRDMILSSDSSATVIWNLFREIDIDGSERIRMNIYELLNGLFHERIRRSNAPFFPMAAKDILYGIIRYIISELPKEDCHNKELYQFIEQASINDVIERFDSAYELRGLNDYLRSDVGITEQTQGIYAELRNIANELFIGTFCEKGSFSVRNFVRNKGARILFIEYDISVGSVLAPLYKTIFDLAIKETLSRNHEDGNVYFVIDEFSLLPNLYHISNGVNFGRSLGAKFIVAIQNCIQVIESYGKENGYSILSAFGTYIAFRSFDSATIKFIKEHFGTVRRSVLLENPVPDERDVVSLINGYAVEDWEVLQLGTGEAIISIPEYTPNPVKFKFKEIK